MTQAYHGNLFSPTCVSLVSILTVYDRIDATATINFSMQFGAATIRERCLFESSVYFVRRGYRLKVKSEHKHKDSVLVLLRTSESGVRGRRQVLSGMCVNN